MEEDEHRHVGREPIEVLREEVERAFCQKGMTSICDNTNPANDIMAGVYGYSHTTGVYDGGQAEYVRVPFADVGPMGRLRKKKRRER